MVYMKIRKFSKLPNSLKLEQN